MNKYRNTVTGAVITTPCSCAGENWEPVKGKGKKAEKPEKEPEKAPEEQPEEAAEDTEGGTVIGPAPQAAGTDEAGAAESNE